MRRILFIAWKELRQIRRDRSTLLLLLALPALMIGLFGYALSLDVDEVSLAVLDLDRSPASRALVRAYTAADVFVVVHEAPTEARMLALLDAGAVRAGLSIPHGYGAALAEGRGADIQLVLDGADSNTARIAQGYAQGIASQLAADALAKLLPGRDGEAAPLEVRTRILYNPGLESAPFVVPGLLGIVLLIATTLMTAMSLARERELGTLEALIATPVGRLELIIGKTLPFIGAAALDVALALLVAWLGFGVTVRGSALAFGLATLLFVAASLGFGLVISTLARTQQAAFQLGLMTTLLPSFLLSGFVFPVEGMVAPVRLISALIPARYYLGAVRSVVLRGAGLADIGPDLLGLLAFAIAMPLLAALRFHKRLG